MKYNLIWLVFACSALRVVAQKEHQGIADKFQLFYNQEQADSIFALYALVLQAQLPPEKNKTVITGLHIRYGDLKSLTILKQEAGYARYKARFKDQTLVLVLAFSAEGSIEALRFIPYTPDQ